MSIASKLNYLIETKQQIKQAIVAKGVTVSDADTFRSYATKIGEISGGGGGGIAIPEGTTDFSFICYNGNPITTNKDVLNIIADFTRTHSITDMGHMFERCSDLANIPQLYTNNVMNMNRMFYACSNLISIFAMDMSKVEDMSNMFDGCSSLTSVSLINTSSIGSKWGIDSMFSSKYGYGPLPNLKHLTFDPNQTSYACDNLVFDLAWTGINDDASATETFNSLPNLTTMGTNNHHTINLPASNSISDSVKQIAIGKGWTLTQ